MSDRMIDELLASGVVRPVSEVTSYYAGRLLGAVPIASGQVTETATGPTLGFAEFTVPATREWIPSRPDHPLAANGQEIIVRRGWQLPDGNTVGWAQLGRFRIASAIPDDSGWIDVVANTIDTRLDGDRWIVDTRTAGSFAQQARQICHTSLHVRVHALDRGARPRTWTQGDPRRDALFELCDAWGTVPRIIDGQLTIVPEPTSRTPTHTVFAGPGGTLHKVSPGNLRERVPNVVVASSAPADGSAPVQAMARVTTGPRSWTGPYGREIQFFSSPFLSTERQCQAAAQTRLNRVQAQAVDVQFEAVTDPRIRLDTVVRVIDEGDGTDVIVRVSRVRHALTAGQEPAEFGGTVLSGTIGEQQW